MKIGDKVIRNISHKFFNQEWTKGKYKNEMGIIKDISNERCYIIWSMSAQVGWYSKPEILPIAEPNDIMRDIL